MRAISSNEKLHLLVEELRWLRNQMMQRDPDYQRIVISRPDLIRLIRKILNIKDRHTAYSWIDALINDGIILPNPHKDSGNRYTPRTVYVIQEKPQKTKPASLQTSLLPLQE